MMCRRLDVTLADDPAPPPEPPLRRPSLSLLHPVTIQPPGPHCDRRARRPSDGSLSPSDRDLHGARGVQARRAPIPHSGGVILHDDARTWHGTRGVDPGGLFPPVLLAAGCPPPGTTAGVPASPAHLASPQPAPRTLP